MEALQQGTDYDYRFTKGMRCCQMQYFTCFARAEFSAPLFKSGMTKLEDVRPGEILTGKVSNATHFGAFVDVGVGKNGLVHSSKMGRSGGKLEVGQRVEVKVLNIDIAKGRIGLELLKLL